MFVPAFMTSKSLKSSSPNLSISTASGFVMMMFVELCSGSLASFFLFVGCWTCFCDDDESSKHADSSGLSSADRRVPAVIW